LEKNQQKALKSQEKGFKGGDEKNSWGGLTQRTERKERRGFTAWEESWALPGGTLIVRARKV